MQQDLERTEWVERIKAIIQSKGSSQNSRWVRFDWRAAEVSLLAHACFHKVNSIAALRRLAELHKAYEDKSTPQFYTYFTIRSILERNSSIQEGLRQQTIKTEASENHFQNIAVLIFMRDNLAQQCRQTLLKENIQKLRSATLLSIIKVNEWQQSFRTIIEYPVFFDWRGSPYLLQLLEDREGILKEQSQYQPEPNPLLLKRQSEILNQPIIAESLSILKSQKARLLQLTLKLPFYAKVVDRSKFQTPKSQQRIILHPFRNKFQSTIRKDAKYETELSSLSEEQLKVIKKFKSLKNVRKESMKDSKENGNFFPRLEVVNKSVKNRIQVLRQKVKQKTESSRIVLVREQKVKPVKSGIKILLQKQVEMKQMVLDKLYLIDSANPSRKQKDAPMLQNNKQKQGAVKRRQSLASEGKLETFIRESKLLAQFRGKQEKSLNMKGQSLKSIKEDLFAKFMSKSMKVNVKANSQSPKKKKVQSKEPAINIVASINASLSQQLAQQKKRLQLKKEKMLEETNKLQNEFSQKIRLFEQKQRISKQIEVELSIKKMMANELSLKLQSTKSRAVEDSQDNALAQIKRLKQKKLMEYNLQKQKMQQIQDSLQKKLSQEQIKHGQLSQEKIQKENAFKSLYEKKVQKLRQEQLQEQMKISEKMRMNEQRLKSYEQKMKLQEQRLSNMQRQLAEWNEKEGKLLALLKKERQREQEIERQKKIQRQRRIQQEITELEEQQNQFLAKYKQANHILISQLEELKHKNVLLQQKLK